VVSWLYIVKFRNVPENLFGFRETPGKFYQCRHGNQNWFTVFDSQVFLSSPSPGKDVTSGMSCPEVTSAKSPLGGRLEIILLSPVGDLLGPVEELLPVFRPIHEHGAIGVFRIPDADTVTDLCDFDTFPVADASARLPPFHVGYAELRRHFYPCLYKSCAYGQLA
jgi:hypothetical protein